MSITRLTSDQYRALQRPVTLPNPQSIFDQNIEVLVAKKLLTYGNTDPFRRDLLGGLFLLIPRIPKLDLNVLMRLVAIHDGILGVNSLEKGTLMGA